jgi:hypothetical protein
MPPKFTRFHPYNTRSSNLPLTSSTKPPPTTSSFCLPSDSDVIVSKRRTRQDDEAMNELPLAVLKKLKAGPPVGGHLNQMEQRAFSVTSLQFAVPSSASTTPRPLAIAAKPPDSLQPS